VGTCWKTIHLQSIPDPRLAKSTSRGFEDSKRRQIDAIVKPGVLQGILWHPGCAVGHFPTKSWPNHKGSVLFSSLAVTAV